MAASSDSILPRTTRFAAIAGVGMVLCWFFPLVHVVPLERSAAVGPAYATTVFNPQITAAKIWKTELPAEASRATELKAVVTSVRENPDTAKTKFAKSAGLGVAYFFVRGSGRVVTRERNYLRLAVDGAEKEIVAVRIGPVFGNTVRDGCGLLDVNALPGLQEFNALSAELNALVEKDVLPVLREKANVGATVQFAGCAEAPETAADAGEPVLTIVPVQAEVR